MERIQIRRVSVRRIRRSGTERILDEVPVEEPLSIRIAHWFKDVQLTEGLSVTMRTPGHDRELAAGFLFAEGIVQHSRDILELRPLGGEPSNEILAVLAKDVDLEIWRTVRSGFVNSSCGVCGKRSREAITQAAPLSGPDHFCVSASVVEMLPALLG